MITAQGIGSGLDVASIVSQLVAAEGQGGLLRIATREASLQSQLSSLGSLKSALSQFQDALNPVKDIEQFRSRVTTSTNEEAFSASAGTNAVPSTYEIEVINLAESHKLASDGYASPETSIGYGTLTFQLGADSENTFSIDIPEEPEPEYDDENNLIEVDARTSLEAIRDAINSAEDNLGVGASIVEAEDGAHLIITSNKTGLENELTITAEGGDGGLAALEFGGGTGNTQVTELRAALDATIKVDSFTRTSSSNVINDVVDDVNINLLSADAGSGQLTVEFDQSVATEKVKAFVDSYNTLVDAFASFSNFDAETNTASSLLGDSTLREISSALRREIGGGGVQGNGFFRSLSVIGVTTETDGKLTLDVETLKDSLDEDFDSVGRLLADEETGFATRLDAVLEPFTQTGGRIDLRTDGLKESVDLLDDQREALDTRLASVERRYLAQFSALDGIISGLTSTSSFLAAQLGNLPGAASNG
ncbi:MAG: flagellar filament capping protein FliD [Gammaproteobacteria bacterium]